MKHFSNDGNCLVLEVENILENGENASLISSFSAFSTLFSKPTDTGSSQDCGVKA